MDDRATWGNFWRYVAGIGACLVLGWFAFVRGVRVPMLGLVDLGFHELGHMITYVFPDIATAVMGSVAQVLMPFGFAVYFLVFRRDLLATGLCLAWAGTSAQDVSVYIADAPFERLQLIGGEHDWAFALGPDHLDLLDRAGTFASIVKGLGLALLIAGVIVCALGLFQGRGTREPEEREAARSPESMWR